MTETSAAVVVLEDEKEIRAEVWKGSVPICLTLAAVDVATLTPPVPIYLMASRGTFLPLVVAASAARERFALHAPAGFTSSPDGIWCEALRSGVPLKWQLPIGVLYDLHCPEGEAMWEIALHFQAFPTGELLRLPVAAAAIEETIKTQFMSSLKEAVCLKHGSVSPINSLSQKETLDLWVGLSTNDEKRFWTVNAKLDTMMPKNVPIRVCRGKEPVAQDLIAPMDEMTGQPRTLGKALMQILGTDVALDSAHVLVQGTHISLETPVAWLSRVCAHPDNFLYVVVK